MTFKQIRNLNEQPKQTTMLYSHGDDTASACRTHNCFGGDVAEIVAHSRGQIRTMGYCFLYAVRGDRVVRLMKRGHFAQRDLRPYVGSGYTEFFYSDAFSTKTFMLATGEIVALAEEIDCSPNATARDAARLGRALGL